MVVAKLSALSGIGGLEAAMVDNIVSVFNLLACTAYLYVAIGHVYGAAGRARVVQSIVLALSVAAIVIGYRFLLFLITLYAG
jgi:hypothetical protein